MFPLDPRHDRPEPREYFLRFDPLDRWLGATGRNLADVAAELGLRNEVELAGYFTGNTPAPERLAIRLSHLMGIGLGDLAQIRPAGGARFLQHERAAAADMEDVPAAAAGGPAS